MWRVVYRELRAVTNDATLALNPIDINDIYDHVWDIGTLLTSEDCLTIFDEGFRPWPKVKHGTEESWDFYGIHEREKAADLAGCVHTINTITPKPTHNDNLPSANIPCSPKVVRGTGRHRHLQGGPDRSVAPIWGRHQGVPNTHYGKIS